MFQNININQEETFLDKTDQNHLPYTFVIPPICGLSEKPDKRSLRKLCVFRVLYIWSK